ncbi:hypothetical protein KEJ51_08125 [Candidatus Bathyarchaeota archaeon]|nr:hypothetical protein [Candidatus Bathyarchaeota archaeon]MBS7628617.1 hypothetical protein [Candidatus Bathyarchaeota archaeon]MBS7631831.1 hypothetical protein [Candidatus Bathyarchaeota archaeon]
MRIVMNASTTILLAKTNLLRLVDEQFDEVLISKKVFKEAVDDVRQLGFDDVIITEKEIKEGRIKVREVGDRDIVRKLMQDFAMREGEAETLVLAIESRADLVATDDHQCMKAGMTLDLPLTQAIALVVALFEAGKITKEKVLEAIERLKEYGWYADWIIENARNRIR